MNGRPRPGGLLVVKLADLGDALSITPALQALAESSWRPIDLLVTPHTAVLFAGWAHGEVITLNKRAWDRPRSALRPGGLLQLGGAAARLRGRRYAALALMHHLTTRWGRLKYRALLAAVGAPLRAGLDNGQARGLFNAAVEDRGFGAMPESAYALRVAATLGAEPRSVLTYRHWLPDAGARTEALLEDLGLTGTRPVALHPGVGAFAPARAWPAAHWASLAVRLGQEGRAVVWVGGAEQRDLVAWLQSQLPAPVADACGRTDLPTLAGLLSHCSALASSDGGPVHLAAACGCPVVSLYGPTDAAAWRPSAETVVGLSSPAHCAPCLYQPGRAPAAVNCPPGPRGQRLPFCMELLPPELVISALRPICEAGPARRAVGSR